MHANSIHTSSFIDNISIQYQPDDLKKNLISTKVNSFVKVKKVQFHIGKEMC